MVMSIRVLRPATPMQKLEQAQLYLEAFGTSRIEQAGDTSVLVYDRQGSLTPDVRFPIVDTGSMSIKFDKRHNQWECTSSLFGIPIRMNDPKLFSLNVLSMTQDRIGSKIQFMSKVAEYWQRYSGDGVQFANRLAKDMVNTGTMSFVTDGGPVFAHFHNDFDTNFDVWFSRVEGAIQPQYRFGFYPEAALQPFDLSVEGTQLVIKTLQQQLSYVETFLKPLISVF